MGSVRSTERGFSIVESLVVTLLVAGVLALGSSLFAGATRTFSRETTRVFLQQDVTAAVNMVLDDLSVAGHRPDDLLASAAGAYAVLPTSEIFESVDLAGTTDTVSFRADVDSDGTTERLCYRVHSGMLTRSVTDVGTSCASIWADPSDDEEEVLLEQVESFDLTFLAEDRTVLAEADVEASGARSVRVDVVTRLAAKGGDIERSNRGETAIRN
jgi:type II secretory pathway pseudopilin PulG